MAEKIAPNQRGGRADIGGADRSQFQGRWREPQRRPTRAPHGEVLWWERSAPEDSDPGLWQAVQSIHVRRQQLGMSVTELARRLSGAGRPIRRETLSRILNGKQPTTWDTAERLAHILGIELNDPGGETGVRAPR